MGQNLIDDFTNTIISSNQVEKLNERMISEYNYCNNNNQRKLTFPRQSLCTNISYKINSTNPSSVSSASSSSTSSLSSPNSFQINNNNNNNNDSATTTLNYASGDSVNMSSFSSLMSNHDSQCNIKLEVDNNNPSLQIYSPSDCKNFELNKDFSSLNDENTSVKLVKTLDYVNNSSALLFDLYDCKSKFFFHN